MPSFLDFAADASEIRFAAGEIIIKEGQSLTRLFILQDGEVEVRRDHTPVCKISKQGSAFGELSALLGVVPTASVIASKPTAMRVIEDAAAFFEGNPAATLEIARLLAHRVNWMTYNYVKEMDDGDSSFWRSRG
jgi:CRP/FNR family cyclic AMP-dependent transcriptional regulator